MPIVQLWIVDLNICQISKLVMRVITTALLVNNGKREEAPINLSSKMTTNKPTNKLTTNWRCCSFGEVRFWDATQAFVCFFGD